MSSDGLDIGLVISNAGAGNPGPFISLPHERLREIVRLNVFAHFDLAHHFGQKLAERGRGGLVLVSAVAAAGGLPYIANDSATKAYVPNLGEALYVKPGQAGVTSPCSCRYSLTCLSSPALASTGSGCPQRPSRPNRPSIRR